MSSYAIVETGSKQYRVEAGNVIQVEKLPVEENQKEVQLERVLLVRDGDKVTVGQPEVKGAKVICELLDEVRGPKVINFKFRRRKASERKRGHRQTYSRLKVKEIVGAKG